MSLDLVICSVPKMDLAGPYVGPALLKSYLETHGFKVLCLDLNIELFQAVGESYEGLWIEDSVAFFPAHFFKYQASLFPDFIEKWARKIVGLEARFVGVSCITYADRVFSYELIKWIKKINPQQKILIGGTDAGSRAAEWTAQNLVEYFILGDAEEPLLDLLSHAKKNGGADPQPKDFNSERPHRLKDLARLPMPDYSDVAFQKYPKDFYGIVKETGSIENQAGGRLLYITSSRGCVRACGFCDIRHYWPSFLSRSGVSVAEEMIEQNRKHGVRYFYFTDSLINGNVVELRKMCERLKAHHASTSTKLLWRAQFIVNRAERVSREEIQLMADAGCDLLIVGVESGSERLRDLMSKKFSNSDLEHLIRLCHDVGIRTGLLLLVGYPTETDSEFKETVALLDVFDRYRKAIDYVSIGHTMYLLWDTPAYRDMADLGVVQDYFGGWRTPGLEFETRLQRLIELRSAVRKKGFRLRDPRTEWLSEEVVLHRKMRQSIEEAATVAFEPISTARNAVSSGKIDAAKAFSFLLSDYWLMKNLASKKRDVGRWQPLLEDGHLASFQKLLRAWASEIAVDFDSAVAEIDASKIDVTTSDSFKLLFYLRSATIYRAISERDLGLSKAMLEPYREVLALNRTLFSESLSKDLVDDYQKRFGPWRESPLSGETIRWGLSFVDQIESSGTFLRQVM